MTLTYYTESRMIIGLSTDTKPTVNIAQNMTFYESDTGNIYDYKYINQTWNRRGINSLTLLKKDYSASNLTIPGSGTNEVFSETEAGFLEILYSGDGDGGFNMQVVIDGVVDDTEASNVSAVYIGTFASSLVVQVQNPSGISATHSSSSFRLRGLFSG